MKMSKELEMLTWFIFQAALYFWSAMALLVVSFLVKQVIYCRNTYNIFKKNGIPGPAPSLFVGNFFQLYSTKDPNQMLDNWLKEYGNVFGFFFGSTPHLIINDAEIIQEIMIRKFKMFKNREPLGIPVKPVCDSILTAEGDSWKNMRRVIAPAFSASKIRLMSAAMNQSVNIFLEELTALAQRRAVFNISDRVQALTLDVIGKFALALDLNCQRNLNDSFFNAVRDFFKFGANIAVKMAIFFPILGKLLRLVNDNLTAGKMTDRIVANLQVVIKQRRENGGKGRTDLLQLLLDSADELNKERNSSSFHMNDQQIIANSHLFLLAGYDTTGTSLTYTCYLLAKHQDIQDRLHQEITEKLKNIDDPTYEDIMGLQYLDQVWNESLRYYPPVTMFIKRVCYEDCEINGVFIPKGVVIQIPVNHIHHDPHYHPDPWKFDPDRFLPENVASMNPGAYLPFGIGPRKCIGMKFALFAAKLALARLFQKFRLEFGSDSDNTLDIICPIVVSHPENAVNLRATIR